MQVVLSRSAVAAQPDTHFNLLLLAWQEQARERDRQFAEKLAREINSAGAPGPGQGGSNPAQGSETRAAASAQARLRTVFPDADADVLLSTLLVDNSDFESARKVRSLRTLRCPHGRLRS